MEITTIVTLCAFSFLAGFIDAIVGGGGLIQTPALLFTLPQYPVTTLIGTTKIPSLAGSLMGAFQYNRRVVVAGRFIGPMMIIAFGASWLGSWTLTQIPNTVMKPIVGLILVAVFIYTFTKKDFGQQPHRTVTKAKQRIRMGLMGVVLGFYDGFFGPGTGSFLVLGFITLIGFDFLKASAHAKLVNVATNLASTLFFIHKGGLLYVVALPMAVANLSGAFFGARLAILKGNQFIRIFFLLVVAATILRFGWDLVR